MIQPDRDQREIDVHHFMRGQRCARQHFPQALRCRSNAHPFEAMAQPSRSPSGERPISHL
jgi:hypothetical protein